MDYRPQSPDLSSYAPASPDLTGLTDNNALPSPRYGHQHSQSRDRYAGAFGNNAFAYGGSPTSVPIQAQYYQQPHQQYDMAPSRQFKSEFEDDEYLPDAPLKSARRTHQTLPPITADGSLYDSQHSQLTAPLQGMSTELQDPTLGVQLKTSFPVARIKRLMQADEDIGKVAQVTPHAVSRALELFMIKLISVSAVQADGVQGGGSGSGKGPKKILPQHLKKAMSADENFDFLAEIVAKVPDAASKGKKEAASDSEDGGLGGGKPGKRKGKKRSKDSGDDF